MKAFGRRAAACLFLLILGVPRRGAAQAVADSGRLASVLRGVPLRTGNWKFAQTLIRAAGDSQSLGTRTVAVSASVLAGNPVWMISEERRGTVVETADTVTLLQSDLSPQHWAARIGSAQVGVAFTGDSAFGAMETYRGRSSFTAAISPGIILSAAMLESLVEALPLQGGYHVAASLMTIGDVPKVMAVDIAVDGEDMVLAGPGSVAAWRVLVRTDETMLRLWISKSDHRVVKKDESIRGDHLVSTVLP